MKLVITHLLAVGVGILMVIIWPARTDRVDTVATGDTRSKKKEVARSSSHSIARAKDSWQSMEAGISKPLVGEDLDSWLERKKGDSHSFAEALVIAGLLTDNPDLIRQGIETDPENEHLLFIGATLSGFSEEERLAMSKRLLEADPANALAAFITAANLLEGGQSDAAIQILRGSTDRHKMEDFRIATQLMTEEALVAAGLSPDAAKFQSAFNFGLGYLSDLHALASSLKASESSMSPDEASELRSLTALMGQRLADQSKSGTMIDHLMGMAIEEATLNGLSNEAPSPYGEHTVSQARESIVAERKELRQVMEGYASAQDLLQGNPDLMRRFIDHFRLMGELEAAKWLIGETESGR